MEHVGSVDLPKDLEEIVARLIRHLQPECVYLFGSMARGESTEDSDYDIMVVVKDSDLPQYRRHQQARRIVRDIPRAKDILVWTRDEFNRRVPLPASLPAQIVKEGKLLYRAA